MRTEQARDLTPDTLDLIASHVGPIYSFVGKRDHTELALLAHLQPFDFVLPGESAATLDLDAEVVPLDAARHTMWLLAKQSLGVARRVQLLARAPLVHFESPPPASPEWLSEVAGWNNLAPDALRLKAWRLYSAVMKDGIEALGGVYVPSPPRAFDARGFLRAEFCRNATHANARYGDLLIEQIETLG